MTRFRAHCLSSFVEEWLDQDGINYLNLGCLSSIFIVGVICNRCLQVLSPKCHNNGKSLSKVAMTGLAKHVPSGIFHVHGVWIGLL